MIVIGVDPAPARKSTVFDGYENVFHSFTMKDLGKYLRSLQSKEAVLVCWDAPLTGPADPNDPGSGSSDFSQRKIEQFFSRKKTKFKTPRGISVRPYSGCSHWAISRAVVGLPRVGFWDADESELPFSLITSGLPPDRKGQYIVEVHPAVAAWLWCKNYRNGLWNYKEDKKSFGRYVENNSGPCTIKG